MQLRRWAWRMCVVASCVLATGCAEQTLDAVGSSHGALIGGTPDRDTPLDNSTVRLAIVPPSGNRYECAGTLVSPTQIVRTRSAWAAL